MNDDTDFAYIDYIRRGDKVTPVRRAGILTKDGAMVTRITEVPWSQVGWGGKLDAWRRDHKTTRQELLHQDLVKVAGYNCPTLAVTEDDWNTAGDEMSGFTVPDMYNRRFVQDWESPDDFDIDQVITALKS